MATDIEIAWQGPDYRMVLADGQYGWQRYDPAIGWRACNEDSIMAELRRRILALKVDPKGVQDDAYVVAPCESPYTRVEFIKSEWERGIKPHYGELLAAAAERAGIVWRGQGSTDNPAPVQDADRDADGDNPIELERAFARAARAAQDPITLNGRLETLERELADLKTNTLHSLEYWHKCATDGVVQINESVQGAHDRLMLHDTRLTELESRTTKSMATSLAADLTRRRIEARLGMIDADHQRIEGMDHAVDNHEDRLRTIEKLVEEHQLHIGRNERLEGQMARLDEVYKRLDWWDADHARINTIEHALGDPPWTKSDLDALLNRVNALEVDLKGRALLWVEQDVRLLQGRFDMLNSYLVDGISARLRELESVVRRLDSDMALVRDAVCPPQGAPFPDPADTDSIDANRVLDEMVRMLRSNANIAQEAGELRIAAVLNECASIPDRLHRGVKPIDRDAGDRLSSLRGNRTQEYPPPGGFLDWWKSQLVPGTHAAYLEIGSLKLAADGLNAITIRNLCERAWNRVLTGCREEIRELEGGFRVANEENDRHIARIIALESAAGAALGHIETAQKTMARAGVVRVVDDLNRELDRARKVLTGVDRGEGAPAPPEPTGETV